MNLPTLDQIKDLHKKYSKSKIAYNIVFTHCKIVGEIAEQMIKTKQLSIDLDFIQVASLVHDIGAYIFINADGTINKKDYIRHGVEGAIILKEAGFDEAFIRIAERHTGVGLYKEDVINDKLPLPVRDYLAETQEERLIMYADKFHSKDPCFNTFSWYSSYVSRFGEKKVQGFKTLSNEFGIPNLSYLIKKYNMRVNE